MDNIKKNLHIQYNDKIIEKLKAFDFHPDVLGSYLLVLFALYENKVGLLDVLDDRNKGRRAIVLYRQLQAKGFLQSSKGNNLFELTNKGTTIVEIVKAEFENDIHADDFKAIAQEETIDDKPVIDWIEEYINIFPGGNLNGRYLRKHPREIAERMQEFIKFYKYPKEVILKATKDYIKQQENSEEGHRFTRNASYFIYKVENGKGKISDLSAWCAKVASEENSIEIDTSFMDTI